MFLDNYSLKNYNTFGIDVKTKLYTEIKDLNQFKNVFQSKEFHENKRLIIGAGSNLLFAKDYDGLIISLENKDITSFEEERDFIYHQVNAGVHWHEFVRYCMENKFYGPENLALIPGKVGAAPVQNIGAYGAEQKDFFYSLLGFDLNSGEKIEMSFEDCKFGYRDSIFKHELASNFLIFSVIYRTYKTTKLNTSYFEIERELNKYPPSEHTPEKIYEIVCTARRSKIQDPSIVGNAGSFFKNPTFNNELAEDLVQKFPEIPIYKINDHLYKTSAAWLIERAGWKGFRRADAAVSDIHSLVLLNYGNASGVDILNLSVEIQDSIFSKFGIHLDREVVLISN
ncbi:MAG: UDP-N-acetylmuramate dehydrogenase [Candidatus Kapabacteria bacterium]|nr:UDP-N-acetylmuramate dehydrogenase [Candidatus Kapabacteria bacterium]